MTRRAFHFAIACIALALPSTARADISIRLNNAQLTSAADLIVIGRAMSSQSRWIDRTLVTAVVVRVEESLKGDAAGDIEVLLPGGVDANRKFPVSMTYPGAPTMQSGERVFLFLSRSEEVPGYIVSGFAQGKFSIVTDARGDQRVSRDLRGSQLVEGSGIARGTATLTSLADFRAEIARLIAQQ
jgi:hypothetical protein